MANTTLALATMNANTEGLTNPALIQATEDIFRSYAAIDTSMGALAYSMRQAQRLFAGLEKGEKLDGYKSFADYCEKRIGVKSSQAFNLAKAGTYLTPVRDSNGTLRFMDKWTLKKLDIKPEAGATYDLPDTVVPFSNTALVRFAEYIGKDDDKDKRNRLETLIRKGKITPDMSVSAMLKVLNPPQIKAKATDDTDDTDDDDADGNDSNQLDSKTEEERQQEKVITVSMSMKTWLALKTEMVRFTSMEEYGEKGLPAMWAFLKQMQEKEGV